MNRRQLLGAAMASAAGTIFASAASAAASRRPNFIIILCDDLGYGDIGATGGRTIATPNLDRMAREGLTLTDYYAPANLCTMSRAGLLTGQYPIRAGLGDHVLLAKDSDGLPLGDVTIAEALKPAYRSALIGKWHVGHAAPYWPPSNQGFDLFYGIPYSHDIEPLKLYENAPGRLDEVPFQYENLQQMFYARAARFIEDNRARPFFLELALSGPHLPNYPHGKFAGGSKAGAYGDVVEELDDIAGRLLAKLKALDLDRDTLVIFTSDNGPWFEGSTGGLRQRKGGGAYDGGYRVPLIARWPGRIRAGARSDAIAMGTDFLPTFCALASLPSPPDVTLDGLDISPILLRQGASPHDELVLFDGENVVGIRTQKWKYISADYFRGQLTPFAHRGYPQLYDMADKREEYSVASLRPDVVGAMDARLRRAAALFDTMRTHPPDNIGKAKLGKHVPTMWQD